MVVHWWCDSGKVMVRWWRITSCGGEKNEIGGAKEEV